MTPAQRFKIFKLKQASDALEQAKRHIRAALGESDVTSDYIKELTALQTEIQDDITDIQCPAE